MYLSVNLFNLAYVSEFSGLKLRSMLRRWEKNIVGKNRSYKMVPLMVVSSVRRYSKASASSSETGILRVRLVHISREIPLSVLLNLDTERSFNMVTGALKFP